MKRLCENIDDINIRGGVAQLTEVVTAMDIALQNIADYTDRLYTRLIKYSVSNKGAQYEKVVDTSFRLREVLYDAAEALNDMQKQIVAYQNKIYRYEEIADSAQAPNQFLVNKNRNVNVDSTVMQFNRNDMINVAATLRNYSERVYHHTKTIYDKKNSIAAIWRDSQYETFSEFVDAIVKRITTALKVFDEYVLYLEEKIKELG